MYISRMESYKDELVVAEEKRLPSSTKKDGIGRQKADGRGFVSPRNKRGTQDFRVGNGE